MPERPKGAVCKIAGEAYGGSNPPPPTNQGVLSKLGPLTSQNSADGSFVILTMVEWLDPRRLVRRQSAIRRPNMPKDAIRPC
jgi:hypothetical protein